MLERTRYKQGISSLENNRRRLISPHGLIAIGVLICIAIILLIPSSQHVNHKLTSCINHDPVTIMYAENLFKKEPNNGEIALTLANIYFVQGKISQAHTLLQPFVHSSQPTIAYQAKHLLYRIKEKELSHYSSQTPLFKNHICELIEYQTSLYGSTMPPLEFTKYIERLNLLHEYLKACDLLMQQSPHQCHQRIEKIAEIALSEKEYETSAEIYLRLMKSASKQQAQDYLIKAMKSLVAGNKASYALALALTYASTIHINQNFLKYAISVSQMSHNPQATSYFIIELLKGSHTLS